MKTITESGMRFGPYNTNSVFEIEKSQTLVSIGSGIKITEFILIRDNNLFLIEAKSSTPNPCSRERLDDFITELEEKFVNALCILMSIKSGRMSSNELPQGFIDMNIETIDLRFMLVINGHKPEWLAPLKDKFEQKLLRWKKVFAMKNNYVLVLNDELARRKNFIQ